ncbi:MAG: agmatinase [bacterium]
MISNFGYKIVSTKPENLFPDYLDLPKYLTNLENAQVVILSIPYESSTTYGKGTKNGPKAILEASQHIETYDEELEIEPCQMGISTQMPFDSLDPVPEKSIMQITEACENFLKQNKFVVSLGGEHTVTVGVIQAFKKYFPNMWVLQLDAHSDLRDSYMNSPLNHACVMARVAELCPYIGLGIRSSIPDERELLKAPSKIFYAFEMTQNPSWPDQALAQLGDLVYITIDLDFFDPSVVSAVGTPEPGGFQWYETLRFLKRVAETKRIIGFDVVELSTKPNFVVSDFFAAKLIYKLLGYIFQDKIKNSTKKNLDY